MIERESQIVFVTGKGGVGKSLVAAALAQAQQRAGKRVLLAEIGDTSYYQDFWQLPAVGHEPVKLPFGFDVALWSGESCLREYVLFYLRIERLYKLFFDNKAMRALINVAPGLSEIAILGKITSGIRRVGPPLNYDTIVVDCFATGHALALLRAPQGMMDAIGFGPMGHHSRDINQVLRNPKVCRYCIVTLAEELPVAETLELRTHLRALLGQDADLVLNKILNIPLSRQELDGLVAQTPSEWSEPIQKFTHYLHLVRERSDRLGTLLEAVANRSMVKVPFLFASEPQTLVNLAAQEFNHA